MNPLYRRIGFEPEACNNVQIMPEGLPRVAVIIVSYNTAKLTQQCLESVMASKGVNLDIYVVENASSDKTLGMLKRRFAVKSQRGIQKMILQTLAQKETDARFPGVTRDSDALSEVLVSTGEKYSLTVLLSQKNLGFGRANNVAAAVTTADFVFFLNSDAFVKPDTIAVLAQQFTAKRTNSSTFVLARAVNKLDNLGIVAAQLHNSDGSLQNQGGSLPTLARIFAWVNFWDDLPGFRKIVSPYQHDLSDMRWLSKRELTKVGWVGGTAMMISRACLDEIGGFDSEIFMYGEDVELCLRATHRHWDVALASGAYVTHLGSASSSQKNAILGEISGLLYMWKKHYSPTELWMLRTILRFGLLLRVGVFGILRRYGQQRIYQEALDLVR